MIAAKMILIWLNRVGRFKIIGEKFDLRRILPLNNLHKPDLKSIWSPYHFLSLLNCYWSIYLLLLSDRGIQVTRVSKCMTIFCSSIIEKY